MVAPGLVCFLVPVLGKFVEDDHGSEGDLRDEHFADVGGKSRAIHRPRYDPRRDQRILCETGNQGLGSPASERRIHRQTLAPFCPAAQACEVRHHCRFIKEDNAIRQGRNGRKAMFEPARVLLLYLRATALGGNQRLFCM